MVKISASSTSACLLLFIFLFERAGLRYRTFPHGLGGMVVFTAADQMAVVQQLGFVIGRAGRVIKDSALAKHLVCACTAVRFVYGLMHRRRVTEVSATSLVLLTRSLIFIISPNGNWSEARRELL